MIVHKTYRYRVYPDAAQVARLTAWEHALRFLWNLALEARLIAYAHARDYRRYPTAFDQMRELTELRAELPWLADVPRNVCAQLLVELDRAWQRCFKCLAERPRWKRKGRDRASICEPHPHVWHLDADGLHFPKLGAMRLVLHRPVEGTPKTCALICEAGQWFACIATEQELADPALRTEPVVGIDRGVVNVIADSDGNIVPNPRPLARSLRRLRHAQRVVSRRKNGSHRRNKAKHRVAVLHRKVRRQRNHLAHTLSRAYANSHGTVAVEKLNTSGMVRANSGLARGILDSGWGNLVRYLGYKLAWSGGRLVEVPAAYSSQECSRCGCVDANSRRSQSIFCCTSCGYTDHADVNAAKNLCARTNRSGMPVEATGCSSGLRSGKSVRLRVPRRPPKSSAL